MEQLLDPWYAGLILILLAMAALGGYVTLERFIEWAQSDNDSSTGEANS